MLLVEKEIQKYRYFVAYCLLREKFQSFSQMRIGEKITQTNWITLRFTTCFYDFFCF